MTRPPSKYPRARLFTILGAGVTFVAVASCDVAADRTPPAQGAPDPAARASQASPGKHTTETLHGKVVWLSDALQRRYGIQTDPATEKNLVVLETTDGQLHPLVLDTRGRAFLVDERLRDVDVELLVRRYSGAPLVQVIRVHRIKPAGTYELDYWCDICSIPMVIQKPCDCCQGATRLRERQVTGAKP